MSLIDTRAPTKKALSVCLFVITLSILFSMPSAYADDLVDLLQVALKSDAKYLSSEQKLLADKEGVEQTTADLLPTVAFQYDFARKHSEVTESDNVVLSGSSDTYSTRTRALTVTQSLFDYKRWGRYAQSKISADRAQLEYDFAKQQLLLRLAENYFLVLERSDQLDTIQTEKAAMQKHLDASKKKLKSGLGSRVDMEDALARYLNALSKEVELQSRFTDSQYGLREVLGFVPKSLARLSKDLDTELPEPKDPMAWVDMSTKLNLEIQILNLAYQIAEKEVSALQSEHAPTLDLVFTSDHVVQGGSVFGGASKANNEEVALQFNMPLYSGGKTSSKIRQAAAKRQSLFYDRNDKRRAIERSAQEAYNRISSAIIQIDALQQSVNAQERLLNSKTSGYQVGQNSMLEILDVQQDLSSAQQALTKARYDYVLNVLRLKFAAGDLREADLAAVNNWLTGGVVSLLL